MYSMNRNEQVNHPEHYQTGGIEAIDYIAAKLGPEGFRAYCLGNVLKYVSRWDTKNGEEDLQKAAVYLEWAIQAVDELDDSFFDGAFEDSDIVHYPEITLKSEVYERCF